jgi:hypothetical protein
MERLWGQHRIASEYLIAFLLASLGYGVLVNVLAVLFGAWRFRYGWLTGFNAGSFPSAEGARF